MVDQSGTTTYGYDGLNRLTSANTSGWTYDNDGNRTTATKTGTPTIYSAYNGADQLCWSSTTSGSNCASPPTGAITYSYDTTGNQTTDQAAGPTLANSFNVFNQLTDTVVGATTTFTSTYADTTNTERLTAGATSFLNGTLGITSQTTSGTTISYIRDPYGNLISMRTAGQSYYYTTDAQGSVIAITDSTQALAATYTYDAWGNTTHRYRQPRHHQPLDLCHRLHRHCHRIPQTRRPLLQPHHSPLHPTRPTRSIWRLRLRRLQPSQSH